MIKLRKSLYSLMVEVRVGLGVGFLLSLKDGQSHSKVGMWGINCHLLPLLILVR